MFGMPFIGLTEAILMIGLSLGYIVLYLANREDKPMKLIGSVIGTFVIVISGILLLSNILINTVVVKRMAGSGVMMPRHHMMMQQQKQMPPQQATPAPVK